MNENTTNATSPSGVCATALESALASHRRASLSDHGTPLQRLPRLSRRLGIELWVKRDDAFTLALGGNKVRQLEYYLGQAQHSGADTVLITGAVQSNFVRLAAAAARVLGMDPVVQLEQRVDRDDPAYLTSGNVLLDRLFGAQIHYFHDGEDEQAADANLEKIADGVRRQQRTPYVIHLGIDHPPIGGLGYVQGAIELSRQIDQRGIDCRHLVVASGSGLTHAGLLVGTTTLLPNMKVHGICVRRSATLQHPRIARRCAEIEQLLNIAPVVSDAAINVDDCVLAPGYGQLNAETAEAVRIAAMDEAMLIDPVYTGRAMAGLIHKVRSGQIEQGDSVIFVHTGGTPGLFAYQADVMQALDNTASTPAVVDTTAYLAGIAPGLD